MKWAIRIAGGLAGVLVLGVVVLFAMGQRASACRMSGSTELNAPPEQVWAWVNEPEKLRQWVSWTVEVRPETPGPRAVGSKQLFVMRDENNGGQLMEIHSTVSEYRAPSRLQVHLSAAEGFDGEQTYAVTDLGGGRSKLEVSASFAFSQWFARLLEPLITPAAEKKLVGDLARLKSLVEGR